MSADRWRPWARGARTGRRYGLADRRARRDVDAPHRRSFVRWPKVLDRYHNHPAGHLPNRRDAMQRGMIRVRVTRRCRADVLDVGCVHANRERITPQFALVHHAMRDRCRGRGKGGNAGKKRKHEARRAERTHQTQTYGVVTYGASCIVSACILNLNGSRTDGMYDGMAIMTYRTTFSLDEATATRIRTLAAQWKVSQAEVTRRVVARTDVAAKPDPLAMLQALHQSGGGLSAAKATTYLAALQNDRKTWWRVSARLAALR